VSISIHRLRQPARSKERGNSFAGGQGADLHSPCTPGRERAATGTPSRLTFALFAVNKICVNLCNLWFNFFYLFSVAKTKCRVIPIVINICAYLIKSEIRISKSETSTNDQNSNDKNRIKLRLSSIVHRPSRLRRAHFIITFGINQC